MYFLNRATYVSSICTTIYAHILSHSGGKCEDNVNLNLEAMTANIVWNLTDFIL